ncbi:Bdr family repetitive protein [Borrelia turicatae]|uniref:Bdr family repetitive protein n=1 Tax=Borrelia turicatae TaxID=142 RepID=UPI001FF11DB9|nr:Bdr family repetitive protein [Borrelia turicatae]UPA15828.1 DUF1640 domain-containing protein [Borrelia turicatae]
MGLAQPVVTQQMVIAELTKAGINRDIAIDLSYRYYKNELTYKDIEFLKKNFDIKLGKVESLLQAEIKSLKTELDTKIDTVENNFNLKLEKVKTLLQAEIKSVKSELDTKIDTKFNELDNKIDNVRSELKSDIKDLDNKLKLHNWMFGTLITLNIGIFLTLMSLL